MIPIVPTPMADVVPELTAINRSLGTWGFSRDPSGDQFVARMLAEFKEVQKVEEKLAAWKDQKVEWVAEGDRILDTIELFMTGTLAGLDPYSVRFYWARCTAVAFKILYQMAAVEAHLDALDIEVAECA